LEWWRINRELRQAKELDIDGFVCDEELDEALELPFEQYPQQQQQQQHNPWEDDANMMMADVLAQEEAAELEALLSAMSSEENRGPEAPKFQDQPDPTQFSDDDDYDAIFMELLSSQQRGSQDMAASQDVEMS
jgi:hypothetical protein